jgi:prephenate dehydrogenase
MESIGRKPLVERTSIIGVGLMGGSIGMALRSRGVSRYVSGYDSPAALADAISVGAIDPGAGAKTSLREIAEGADVILLAVPIHAMRQVLEELAPHVEPHTIITDIGSIKSSIVKWGEAAIGDAFIAGHPMAGSEKTGVLNARADLFEGAAWAFITPEEPGEYSPLLRARHETLCKIVTAIGARPVLTTAAHHDRAAALVSHLPHLISYAYNETIETDPEVSLAHQLAAGSYRDLTRVAASDPVLWRDVFLENREWLLYALARYRQKAAEIEAAIVAGDPDELLKRIRSAGIL